METNSIDKLNIRMEATEKRFSELDKRTTYIYNLNQEENKLNINKHNNNKQSLRDPWDSNESSNILVILISEGEEKEGREKNYMKTLK